MSEHTPYPPSSDTESAGTTTLTGRHPVNVAHLVMGIAFLGLVLIWSLIVSDAVNGPDIRWLLPLPWVAAGLAGVLATVARARR